MSLGRFAALPILVVASFSLSACVFDLSSDEPKAKVRVDMSEYPRLGKGKT